MDDLNTLIDDNKKIRCIDSRLLYRKNEHGVIDESLENYKHQVAIFENDIVRLALKDKNETNVDMQLVKEIIYLEVYHNNILLQIIKDGILIDNKKYIFYSATSGQVRQQTITLIKEEFYEKHKGYLLVGLTREIINKKGGLNVGKYISYMALCLSSSVLPEKEIDIDRCILVSGLETVVKDKVKYINIEENKDGNLYVASTPKEYLEKSVPIEHIDGAGMFLPGEQLSSFQVRSGFFKGCMFPFDFRKFAKEVGHNTIVKDAWGDSIDIEEEDIRYIFTTSQLKMWSFYKDWDEYKEQFKKNNIKLTINNYANPTKDEVRMSYQYLQTLPHNSDIRKLCDPTKERLCRLHNDLEFVKFEMGYNLSDANNKSKNDKRIVNQWVAEALDIYPHLVYDSYIKNKITALVKAERKNALAGKIFVEGYYSYACPDMYAFCEYLFLGIETPKGLISKGYIYNKYYSSNNNVTEVCLLRSPHLTRYEYGKRKLIKNEKCDKWFKYMESDTVVSSHDLISKVLQMDYDGDEILLTSNEELYNLAEDLPPLYYKMPKALPQEITDEAVFHTLKSGFDNNLIGDISNVITKLWNFDDATEETPYPHDDEINVFCAYSNFTIDYPKTGKNILLGAFEEEYRKLLPDKKGFKEPEIKCPNFFIEAKGKKPESCEGLNNSVMNRIKSYISEGTGRLRYSYFAGDGKFDYAMLMNNERKEDGSLKYEVNRQRKYYDKMRTLLIKLKSDKKILNYDIDKNNKKKNIGINEITGRFKVFHYHCIKEIMKVFTNKNGYFNIYLAVNCLLDLEYKQQMFVFGSKSILWECFGHILVQNLKRNMKSDAEIIARPRIAYRKAIKGDELLDLEIAKSTKKYSIEITKSDYDFLNRTVTKNKAGRLYKNDREILFVLLCLYKSCVNAKKTKEGYMEISRRSHRITNGKKVKKIYNFNTIKELAGVKSYECSIKRFQNNPNISLEDSGKFWSIKLNLSNDKEHEPLFTVGYLYDPMLYLQAYEEKKTLEKCWCGHDFIKIKNQKTCSDKCSEKLKEWNKTRSNQRDKAAV